MTSCSCQDNVANAYVNNNTNMYGNYNQPILYNNQNSFGTVYQQVVQRSQQQPNGHTQLTLQNNALSYTLQNGQLVPQNNGQNTYQSLLFNPNNNNLPSFAEDGPEIQPIDEPTEGDPVLDPPEVTVPVLQPIVSTNFLELDVASQDNTRYFMNRDQNGKLTAGWMSQPFTLTLAPQDEEGNMIIVKINDDLNNNKLIFDKSENFVLVSVAADSQSQNAQRQYELWTFDQKKVLSYKSEKAGVSKGELMFVTPNTADFSPASFSINACTYACDLTSRFYKELKANQTQLEDCQKSKKQVCVIL